MLDVMKRAYSYERKVPLYSGQPNGADAAAWSKAVTAARARYDWPVVETMFEKMKGKWSAQRERNHLPNGPLQNSGKPLLVVRF